MLELTNGKIQELPTTLTASGLNSCNSEFNTSGYVQQTTAYWPNTLTYWHSYPVYVCTDKTKKAIEILKALEADKQIKVASVPKFIALVEQIANLL